MNAVKQSFQNDFCLEIQKLGVLPHPPVNALQLRGWEQVLRVMLLTGRAWEALHQGEDTR